MLVRFLEVVLRTKPLTSLFFTNRSADQTFTLFHDERYVSLDLGELTQRRRLVEDLRERDLVADLLGLRIDPRVRCLGQNLAGHEGLDATVLQERDLLEVRQIRVGFVLDEHVDVVDLSCVQSVNRVG